MKRAAIIFLLVALSFQFFIKIGVMGYYLFNYEYVVNALCINKTKPGLHCDGKCYLASKMKGTEEADQRTPTPLVFKYEQIAFLCAAFSAFKIQLPQIHSVNQSNGYTFNYHFVMITRVFHPPPFSFF